MLNTNLASAGAVLQQNNAKKVTEGVALVSCDERGGPRHRKVTSRTPIAAVLEPLERGEGGEQFSERNPPRSKEVAPGFDQDLLGEVEIPEMCLLRCFLSRNAVHSLSSMEWNAA